MIGKRTVPEVDEFLSAAVRQGVARSERGLRSYLAHLFQKCPIADRRVLDVGAGTGFVGIYCLVLGARALTALEPEAAGATRGAGARLEATAAELGLGERVTVESTTLQEFVAPPGSFDLVVLHNSINHLDETACIELLRSEEARRRYEELFARLYQLCAPGGDVLVTDASRRNLFATLRIRNPLAPNIEWEKHQTPKAWSALLESVGFQRAHIGWSSFGRLGRPGRLLANPAAAFVLHSQFVMMVRRPGGPSSMSELEPGLPRHRG